MEIRNNRILDNMEKMLYEAVKQCFIFGGF